MSPDAPSRTAAVTELASPELERLLAEDFDSVEVLNVYADWLEERGEPRGTLIRLQLEAEAQRQKQWEPPAPVVSGCMVTLSRPEPTRADRDFIERQWPSWFPGLRAEDVSLGWRHGFVRSLSLTHDRLAPGALRPLLGRPSLRLLATLAVEAGGFAGTMDGIELPSWLGRIDWVVERRGVLAPLGGRTLPALRTWTLDLRSELSPDDLTGLATVSVPALQRLELRLAVASQASLLGHLDQLSWLTGVERIELSSANGAVLPRLLELRPALANLGRRLTLRLPEHDLIPARDRLRSELPGVHLTPVPFEHPRSSLRFLNGTPVWSVGPSLAPPNHALDAPSNTDTSNGSARVHWGAGVPMAKAHPGSFAACASCAGEDTRCVYEEVDRFDGHAETTTYTIVEYRCEECGHYTRWRTVLG